MPVELNEIEQAEVELEQWLVEQAKNEVPETVLIVLLRDETDDIEHLGYVPRMWGESDQ